jgi:hypothetical protein
MNKITEPPIFVERVPKIQMIFIVNYVFSAFVKTILNFRGCSKNIQFRVFNLVQILLLLNCYFSARERIYILAKDKKVGLFIHLCITMSTVLIIIKPIPKNITTPQNSEDMPSAMPVAAMPDGVAAVFLLKLINH